MGIASTLDRRAQFYRATLEDDGFSQVQIWAPYGQPVWALRQDVKDGEKYQAAQVQAQISTRFHIRSTTFTRSITPLDRIQCEGETFEITGVKQVHPGRRQLIEITAVRRTDGA
jgi:head-tail adaptor